MILRARFGSLAFAVVAAALAAAPAAWSLTLDESARASIEALELASAADVVQAGSSSSGDDAARLGGSKANDAMYASVALGSDAATSAGYEHRSPGKAFALSLLLPGLGQRYAGRDGRALGFFLGEAGLWTTFTVLKIQSNKREEDFEEWAKEFSGATIDGERDEEFYQTISRYLSSDEYNFEIKAIARLIFPGDTPEVRAQQLAYIEENSVRGDDAWDWASPEKRNDFRVIRHRAVEADRRADWTLGGLVLLRILSAIDAVRVTKHENRDHERVGLLSASPLLPSGEPGLALAYSRRF